MRTNLKNARQKAGLTQQKLADELGIALRKYQKIEYGELKGSFELWDALEERFGVHQRILREMSSNHLDPKANQQGY